MHRCRWAFDHVLMACRMLFPTVYEVGGQTGAIPVDRWLSNNINGAGFLHNARYMVKKDRYDCIPRSNARIAVAIHVINFDGFMVNGEILDLSVIL